MPGTPMARPIAASSAWHGVIALIVPALISSPIDARMTAIVYTRLLDGFLATATNAAFSTLLHCLDRAAALALRLSQSFSGFAFFGNENAMMPLAASSLMGT
ncbi:hypothetical protein MRX96_048827 [Rhipicephalus microplus]